MQKELATWLMHHIGGTFSINDLMADMPDGANIKSVTKLLTTDFPRKGFDIETVVRGQVFRFHGVRSHNGEHSGGLLFEQIGTAKDGRLVIQAEDGTIYLAVEVG